MFLCVFLFSAEKSKKKHRFSNCQSQTTPSAHDSVLRKTFLDTCACLLPTNHVQSRENLTNIDSTCVVVNIPQNIAELYVFFFVRIFPVKRVIFFWPVSLEFVTLMWIVLIDRWYFYCFFFCKKLECKISESAPIDFV